MANIHDTASYILSKFDTPLSTMQLQKLAYFSQGWVLALTNRELFAEDFKTWRNGPVSYDLYRSHRGRFLIEHLPEGDPSKLDDVEQNIVDQVVDIYGGLSGDELSDLTHAPGTPWSITREEAGIQAGEDDNRIISKELIKQHFVALQSQDA